MGSVQREGEVLVDDGGSGGPVDVTIIAPLPVPITATDLDIRDLAFATDKVDVSGSSVVVSSLPAPTPIVSTITDTLNVNGDTVVLELAGAAGASALFPDANNFVGTVIFEVSNDGGVEYNEVSAISWPSGDISNPSLADISPSNSLWIFTLSGGETHVRVKVTAYTSGSASVTLTGTVVGSNPLQSALFAGGGGSRPATALLIGGRNGNDARPFAVRGDADGGTDQGMVTWDQSGTRRVGAAMVGANDFGKAIGGIDDGDVFQFAEIRDTTPIGTENGVLVREVGNPTINQNYIEQSGSLTAPAQEVVLDVRGFSGVTFDITGSWTGSLFFQISGNGTDWNFLAVSSLSDTSGIFINDTAANGIFQRAIAGAHSVKVLANALSVGTANIVIRATMSAGANQATAISGVIDVSGSTVVADQGGGNLTESQAWWMKLTDGAGGPVDVRTHDAPLGLGKPALLVRAVLWGTGDNNATVKASTTKPLITDTALVTTRSQNKAPLTPSSPTAVSVGVASTLILAANASRTGARIVNTSAARISLGHGVAAVLDSGDTIYPGGSFSMDDYDFHTGAINGIASAAASNVGAQEFT